MSAFRAAAIVLVVSSLAHSQPAIKIWATDKACPAMQSAAIEIGRVPFPPGWTVLIACNDQQWDKLQRKADAFATRRAFTNLRGRITVVRGAIFLSNPGLRSAHRVLLHEIGHIQCICPDEGKAEAWAASYERADAHEAR